MKITLTSLLFTFFLCSFQTLFASNNLTEAEAVQRVRVKFVSPSGNIRPLLLGFTPDDAASDGVDYGYDAKTMDNYPNDLNWIIEDERYVIQGVGRYETSKFYPFVLFLAETGDVTIALTALENFDSEIPVYLYDAVYDDYTQINDSPFKRFVQPGTYHNRFFLAFSPKDVVLSNDKKWFEDSIKISDTNDELKIEFKNINSLDKLTIYSVDGKMIFSSANRSTADIRFASSNIKNIPLLLEVYADGRRYNKLLLIPK
ncbi:hypothetical protein SAMN03097699_0297 [Flavobacteriaceae bacterium MAR_2010_188]|nr:hypothetical protein SAMN03097699_0297 [Flavobacteriaceae bacterium MAR_2010_188]